MAKDKGLPIDETLKKYEKARSKWISKPRISSTGHPPKINPRLGGIARYDLYKYAPPFTASMAEQEYNNKALMQDYIDWHKRKK
ncbi:hypothetical protein KKE60_05965 [Patescibacteria group bacterium]|nr:hypothetical protein [Patescibacteria group bacterium]